MTWVLVTIIYTISAGHESIPRQSYYDSKEMCEHMLEYTERPNTRYPDKIFSGYCMELNEYVDTMLSR